MTEAARDVDAAKAHLRARVLAARREISADQLASAADAIRNHVLEALPAGTATVALYASTGSEPGTHPLLEALRAGGTRVLLPVLRPDLSLDWARYEGPDTLVPGPRGTVEPTGPRLGVAAVGEASVVLVPGLAADRAGHRLGRGGGSYDRALRHVDPQALVAVVLYPDEIVDTVPVHGHDAAVHAVVSSQGLERVGP